MIYILSVIWKNGKGGGDKQMFNIDNITLFVKNMFHCIIIVTANTP